VNARPAVLVDHLRDRAESEPDRVIFRYLPDGEGEGMSLTFAQLHARARAIAAALTERGARGERALLLHPPGLEYIAALFGCLEAGVVAVPAYPPHGDRSMFRIRSLVRDAQARIAITSSAARRRLERWLEREPELDALSWIASDDPSHPEATCDDEVRSVESLALLQYTSGSTGDPKGVMLSQGNLLRQAELLAERAHITAQDRGVFWLPPYHDMGLVGAILVPVLTGAETTLMSPSAFLQRPLRWPQAMTRYGATISGGPDFAFELCTRRVSSVQVESLDLGQLRILFNGAERVRPDTMERFTTVFGRAGLRRGVFAPCYGMAEATLGVSWGPIGAGPQLESTDEQALGSGRVEAAREGGRSRVLAGSGVPLRGVELAVVDPETRRPSAPAHVGELWVRGGSIAQGYWRRPELTERVFRARMEGTPTVEAPTFLRTGDLGFVREGQVFVTGRLKDLIIILGRKHFPEDIEATALASHPRLRPAGGAAFAIEKDGQEQLVVVHEVDDPRGLPAAEVLLAIRGAVAESHELAAHEVVLVSPGGVPRTSSGKVQRGRCRELYLRGELGALAVGARGPLPSAGREPPPALVETLCTLVASVLEVGRVDPDDDFFALGGHSLLATQLVSRVRETLGVELPIRAAFEAPTPRSLARRVVDTGPAARFLSPVTRIERRGRLQLSFSQERIWFLHQLDPQSSAYNVTGALAIDGPLRREHLETALGHVVARHEVLRCNYPTVDGVPQVVIGSPREVALPVIDLGAEADPSRAAEERAAELASMPFDLAAGALFRFRLFRTGPDRHVMAASLHHIVADGWAMGVLVSELLAAYAVLARGGTLVTEEPPLQYLDYAAWQREQLTGESLRADLAYWRRQVEGAPVLELPTDRPRTGRRSSHGAIEPVVLPPGLIESLREVARAEGATLFMVMLAALDQMLHRHSGQADLVIGVPIANRTQLAAEAFIGTLVNTLPLRVHLDPKAPFTELLRAVRETTLEAYAHQELPFERLVAEVPVARRGGESPLVSVMFDFQNSPMPVGGSHGLRLRPITFSRGASQFELGLFVMDGELGQFVSAEYSTDLFERATIRRLLEHYVACLEAVVADRYTPLAQISLLTPADREEALHRAGATCAGRPPVDPFPRMFEEQARRTPDAVAVLDGQSSLTYRELDEAANALAHHLRELGAGPGERIGLYLERSCAVVVALVAAQKARAAYVPLDPRYPADHIAWVAADAKPVAVVTEEALRSRIPRLGTTKLVLLDGLRLPRTAQPLPSPTSDEVRDDIAYVLYTSGSTGRPKGVEIPALALSNFLVSMRHTPGLAAQDRILSVTSISFDIAGLELLLPLTVGASVYVAPSEAVTDGRRLSDLLRDSSATVMQATPSTWRLLVGAGWRGEERLKMLCGGEALSRELADALLARGGSLWNMYGPTETTIWSTVHRVEPGSGAPPIGLPIDHTRIYLLDEDGNLAPSGVTGEIFIGGEGVARGYFGRPDLTVERFLSDPFGPPGGRMYRTGDAGRFRSNGALEYRGRLDQQVKIRGHRIEPGEIEAVLCEDTGVAEAVVISREDRPGDVRLIAYYVARDEHGPGRADLRELCRRKLPGHMIPSHFVDLDVLPLTPNGKVDRKALPVPSEGMFATESRAIVPPRDDLERKLAALWEEVLGTPVTSVRDGFFELGGHSLLVARLLALIEQSTRVALPFAAFVGEPTIEGLATRIRQQQAAGVSHPAAPRSLLAIRRDGSRSPLFCVHGAGGNVLNLQDLARHLDPAWPVYGLQARGIDGASRPYEDIEDMSRDYLAEIRELQPFGPYYLSGYCGGGIVAYEIAQRLVADGERVGLLALIDPPFPGPPRGARRIRGWAERIAKEDLPALWRRARRKVRRDVGSTVLGLRLRLHEESGAIMPYELRDAWLTRAFLRTMRRHRLRTYPGRLTVLRALNVSPQLSQLDDHLGWRNLAAGGVEVFGIPGGHHTLMLEPHVRLLAARLSDCLRAAESELGARPGKQAVRA
jgi:amino acid adenylation domain-containing protein